MQKREEHLCSSLRGDSCRIQTCNLLIRSQMLYSVELRSHLLNSGFLFLKAGAKVQTF